MSENLSFFDHNLDGTFNMFENYLSEAISIQSAEDKTAAAKQPAEQPADQQAEPQATTAQPEKQSTADTAPAPKNDEPHDNNPVQGADTRTNLDGNARKDMYQKFADIMTEVNSKNIFGSLFSDDAFKGGFNIVPYEMRYFYRMQNPVYVQIDDFKFIPYGEELLDAQDKYKLGKKMFVFATSSNKPVFYNMLDNKVYMNDKAVADTFDGFIDDIINNNGAIPSDAESEAPIGEDETIDNAAENATDTEPATETPPVEPEAAEETTPTEESFIDYLVGVNNEYMTENADMSEIFSIF